MIEVFNKTFNELSETEIKQVSMWIRQLLNYQFSSIQLCDRVSVWFETELVHNSSNLDGIELTKSQVESIYHTGTITGNLNKRQVEEIKGNFYMYSRCLSNLEGITSFDERFMREMHYCLMGKANKETGGNYKTENNALFGMETCSHAFTIERVIKLLADYSKATKNISTLCILHARFEAIQPFQEGNERVAAILLLRECLAYGLMPFIVRSANKTDYIHAITEAKLRGNIEYLKRLFRKEQEWTYNNIQNILHMK